MQYLGQSEKNNLRPLVLAYGGEKSTQEPRWKQECRRRQWNRCWHIGRKAYTDWLAELTQEELPEEECLRRLQVMHYGAPAADFWRQDCSIPVKLPDASHRQEVMTAHAEAAVICGEQTRPLKLMLRFMPEALERRYELEFHDRSLLNLEGTPLALAAAAGRTEAVRVLLNAGFDPDETGRGLLSSLRWFGTNAFPVTPVMAAIYYGEEETARLLLEAGAVCDFSKPLFRALLERGDAHTMETAKALPDTGFDRIPQAWLDALEEKKQLFQTLF